MMWMAAVLLAFPLLFLAALLRRGWAWPEAARIAILGAVGFLTSGPFLTESGMGTGEAFNYSEAVADTVLQMRAGVFPVLVGQSAYAFNGRVHPLRTAMYLTYSAGALDVLTLRRLSFWGIQNLTLAASLFGALFAAYACLRRLGTQGPWLCLFLAILYGLSPPLLAAAYGMDLYMTAAAAPFLPMALLGSVGGRGDGGINPVVLAAGLAGAWLAHPPVAAWLTVACAAAAGVSTLGAAPGTRPLARAAGAAALALLLGGFALVSALNLDTGLSPAALAGRPPAAQSIIAAVKDSGWASLRPVQDAGFATGDFQLGYSLWMLLIAGGLAALRSGNRRATALLAAAVLFIALSTPVPWLNAWLWNSLPRSFGSLTNTWPMQRAYLVVAACTVFIYALSWPAVAQGTPSRRRLKAALALAAASALAWSALQASLFVRRGFATRIPAAVSSRAGLPGNANLTQAAYSFLDEPRNFTNGARDPEAEMRLLSIADGREIQSNAKAGRVRVAQRGRLVRSAGSASGGVELSPRLILEPGKRYRLRLDFAAPRMGAIFWLNGETIQRAYVLPHSGAPNGFGMDLGNSNTIPLWTDSPRSEEVTVSLLFPGNPNLGWSDFAGFTLEEVERSSLPIRLGRLVPFMEGDVDAGRPCWLETPRMFVSGYQALVDGAPADLGRSVDGTVLISVPPGRHHFELRYRGPFVLRVAFAAGAAGWGVVLVGMLSAAFAPRALEGALRRFRRRLDSGPGAALYWSSCALAGAALVVSLVLPERSPPKRLATQPWVATDPHTAFERSGKGGPLALSLRVPASPMPAVEPLLSSGAGPGSSTLYLHRLDETHIAIGLDQWGEGASESPPLPVEPGSVQTLRLTMPALCQAAVSPGGRSPPAWLLNHVAAWLNGQNVFRRTVAPSRDGAGNVCVLRNGSGSSAVSAYYNGDILSQEWLPASGDDDPASAAAAVAGGSGPLRIRFLLPVKSVGQCEPLLSQGRAGRGACVFLNYVDAAHVRIGIQGPGAYFFQSPPLKADYGIPQEVLLSCGAFYPEGGAGSALFSRPSMERLRSTTFLAFNGSEILARADTGGVALDDSRVSMGANVVEATYANARFTGEFDAIDRAPPAQWPALQGSDRLGAESAVGPLQITVLLPRDMVGRNEPLLVSGRKGQGTILIIRYVDPTHVMIGADVWGIGLYWGPPIDADYGRPISFEIWSSALFPEHESLAASVPPSRLAALRKRILVRMEGKVALDVPAFAYDSRQDEITVGRSAIGGSNQGGLFTGTVLVAKRLAPLFE